jgi:hypothetical protein
VLRIHVNSQAVRKIETTSLALLFRLPAVASVTLQGSRYWSFEAGLQPEAINAAHAKTHPYLFFDLQCEIGLTRRMVMTEYVDIVFSGSPGHEALA